MLQLVLLISDVISTVLISTILIMLYHYFSSMRHNKLLGFMCLYIGVSLIERYSKYSILSQISVYTIIMLCSEFWKQVSYVANSKSGFYDNNMFTDTYTTTNYRNKIDQRLLEADYRLHATDQITIMTGLFA
jgi:hypothetical protein